MAFRRQRAEPRRGTPSDLLVVGLGNPGAQYEHTRHNIGVEVVELLAERHGGRLKQGRELALVDDIRIGQCRVGLAFPQTYMNKSGDSVVQLVRRHGIEDLDRLVVVHDEIDLPPGRIKVKRGGGLAGHNGLRSIKQHLHSADFVRIRVGVGRPPSRERGADYVLRRPGRRDRAELADAVERAADAIELLLDDGVEATMNRFNPEP